HTPRPAAADRAALGAPPARPPGRVAAPLGRPGGRRKLVVVSVERGRLALTYWRVIESFAGIASLICCRLETGRTHHIRVHLAHIGHPVLGDPVYATGFKSKTARLPSAAQACVASLSRQALHAAVLGFPHPVTGIQMRFESALPPDLRSLRETLAGGASARPRRESYSHPPAPGWR